jgi:peptide chain release factor 2
MQESAQPEFWNDSEKARDVMSRLSDLQKEVATWRNLEKRVAEIKELAPLLSDEDKDLRTEIEVDTRTLAHALDELEFRLAFSGPYDGNNAIMTIHAGAGGTESQDWADMLMRMYVRWAERHGDKAEILDVSPGEEAGIKSATLNITGAYVYGYLKSEHGVHRLIRLSPFDFDHARHTSFALVEVMPEVSEDSSEVQINPDDIRIDLYRSSGAGGQNVQKTSTAVRLTHIPTGTVVTCQDQRSQLQNKAMAMKILLARLLRLKLAAQAEERARLKGERISAGWSNQIRSYVLHPYKMVKDHRTDFETSDVEGVLDGELDEIINAYLRQSS